MEERHLLIPSGPVSLPPPSRRWKVRKHSIRHVPSRDPAVSVPPDKVHYVTGIQIAGEAQPPANGGNRAVGPSRDSTVVAIDASHSMSDGGGLALPALIMTERHRWTGKPHTETISTLTRQNIGAVAGWPPAPCIQVTGLHRQPLQNKTIKTPTPQSKMLQVVHPPTEGPTPED